MRRIARRVPTRPCVAVPRGLAGTAVVSLTLAVTATWTSLERGGTTWAAMDVQRTADTTDVRAAPFAAADTLRPFANFEPGWDARWEHRHFDRSPTRYTVVNENGRSILEARSEASASGLWCMFDLKPVPGIEVAWRWRVEGSLSGNRAEREKRGDDFAARVFVVFEPSWLRWRTRALCYVWAAQEPVGSLFGNPYAGSVRTIVLRSGDGDAHRWVMERRAVYADYVRAFGEEPRRISGVAVMVDTDDTGGAAVARFDSLTVVIPEGS